VSQRCVDASSDVILHFFATSRARVSQRCVDASSDVILHFFATSRVHARVAALRRCVQRRDSSSCRVSSAGVAATSAEPSREKPPDETSRSIPAKASNCVTSSHPAREG
jgi:hypothetical protein